MGGLGRSIRRWKWKAGGRGVVSEPGLQLYLLCCMHVSLWPPSGAVHSLPRPPFGLGAVDQTRIRPGGQWAYCRVPMGPLPWVFRREITSLAYSGLDFAGQLGL